MHTMITNANLPAYNRFDHIPQHALQIGLSQNSETDISNHFNRHTHIHSEADIIKELLNLQGLELGKQDSKQEAHGFPDGNHSSSAHVSFKTSSLSNKESSNTTAHRELYVDQMAPPPYNDKHRQLDTFMPPSRTDLPKKSEAAQAMVAELLKENSVEQKPFGNCFTCKEAISSPSQACQAMGQIYHSKCFTCISCGRTLKDKAFYSIHGKIYCEEDFMYSGFQQTIEKCFSCGHLIMDTILQALGKSFHPGCFRCTACNQCLDGVQFTVDINNKVYCVHDFHRLFAPKCAACGLPIVPLEGSDETVRVVALDKDYHIDCYQCEKCKVQLTDETDKRCYPLGSHLLCYDCHIEVRSSSLPSPSGSSSSSKSSSSNISTRGRSPAQTNRGILRMPVSPLPSPTGALLNVNQSFDKGFTNKPIIKTPPMYGMNSPAFETTSPKTVNNPYSPRYDPIKTSSTEKQNSSKSFTESKPFYAQQAAEHLRDTRTRFDDPNIRLQNKILQHLAVNKEYKLNSSPTNTSIVIVQQLQRPNDQSPRSLMVTTAPLKDSKEYNNGRANSIANANNAVNHKPSFGSKPLNTPESQVQSQENMPPHITPRAAPVDHAAPLFNRRMPGPRRRLPLTDMIMHKKIAESLKKSISNRQPSPIRETGVQVTDIPANQSKNIFNPVNQSGSSLLANEPMKSYVPHYMKVWQASEIATAVDTAVEQAPAVSKELPLRPTTNDQDKPPERPPKLRSYHIEKF